MPSLKAKWIKLGLMFSVSAISVIALGKPFHQTVNLTVNGIGEVDSLVNVKFMTNKAHAGIKLAAIHQGSVTLSHTYSHGPNSLIFEFVYSGQTNSNPVFPIDSSCAQVFNLPQQNNSKTCPVDDANGPCITSTSPVTTGARVENYSVDVTVDPAIPGVAYLTNCTHTSQN